MADGFHINSFELLIGLVPGIAPAGALSTWLSFIRKPSIRNYRLKA